MSSFDSYSSSSTLVAPMDVDVDMGLPQNGNEKVLAALHLHEGLNKDALPMCTTGCEVNNHVNVLYRRRSSPDHMSLEELLIRAEEICQIAQRMDSSSPQYRALEDEANQISANLYLEGCFQNRKQVNEISSLISSTSFFASSTTCDFEYSTKSTISSGHHFYTKVPESGSSKNKTAMPCAVEQCRGENEHDQGDEEMDCGSSISDEQYKAFCLELEGGNDPGDTQRCEESESYEEDSEGEGEEYEDEAYLKESELDRKMAIQLARGYEAQERRRSLAAAEEIKREVEENKDDAEWLNSFMGRHGRGRIF